MNLSAPFIKRPVMTTVLMAAMVLFGFFAYTSLPVSELPKVDFPTVVVYANLPGANPQTMSSTVATPLERSFSSIAGVTSITSVSSTGRTRISLQFDLERDIDAAAQDVQTAIQDASRDLPESMPSLPTLRKVNPNDHSIIYIAFSARHLALTKLDEYAETRVAQRLSTLPGVAEVNVWGSKKYAVRIYINPYALNARGLSLSQVRQAISTGNSNLPAGTISGGLRDYTVRAEGQLTSAKQYNNLVLAYNNGAPIRLDDVGHAFDSVEENKQETTYNGGTSIVLSVQRQPGANTVKVAQEVRDILPALEKQAPGGAKLNVIYDRSRFINASIHDVSFTLLLAIALVIVVIFLFLRNGRATLVSALALPTSLVGTFALMYLFGFGLNNLTLMALTLAVGFVVDDAIVVQENIVRYMEMGHPPLKAAMLGSREISFTVLSMTLSLVAVFIPILFMGGVVGRLFSEFAITIAIAILLSGVVSLTLTPMLSGRVLRPIVQHGRFYQMGERLFDRLRDAYVRTLSYSVHHWRATLGVAAILFGATAFLFVMVPKGFIPTEDSGVIYGFVRGPEGMTFPEMQVHQRQLTKLIQHTPGVEGVMSSVGQGRGGTSGESTGFMMIGLAPHNQRPDAETIIRNLRREAMKVGSIEAFFSIPTAINVGTGHGNSPYDYVLQGSDLATLQNVAQELQKKAAQIPGITDLDTDLQLRQPQINVHIERSKASALGVNPADIQNTLYSAFGGQRVSQIYGETDEYEVLMELAPQFQRSINALDALYVPSRSGTLVPLSSVAQIEPGVGPLEISHYDELPSVTLSFNTKPGVSLGEVTAPLLDIASTILPSGVTGTFAGNAQVFQESMHTLPILLLITVLVIYMVLAILYEHFIHPVTILTALPLAIFGALIALLIMNQVLNLFSFVGLILLVGLVKKNGIIMIDFALHARRNQGLDAEDAIIEACRIRFRPILMTSVAAILGTLPIAIGFGVGAEARRPLGIAAVGGLIFAQFLTLYITPAFYVAMEKLSQKWRGEKRDEVEEASTTTAPRQIESSRTA
ncbi:MAG TPA: efflux RND transporter permease subunit [Gammaproteobacteria bacterium]|nr:efflux RND transporter permease subunit [Gammaproteobacteria bacterium]